MNHRLVFCCFVGLSLAACGGGDDTTNSGSGGSTVTSSSSGSGGGSTSSTGEGGSGGFGGGAGGSGGVGGSGGIGGTGGAGGSGGSGGSTVEPQVCGGFLGTACPDTMFCDFPDAQCGATDGSGICVLKVADCDKDVSVCGCDGVIYADACAAHAEGVDEATVSHCSGKTGCGGHAGKKCQDDEFCDYSEDICGAADGGGTCKPRNLACTPSGGEVCACDGTLYANACAAQLAGADVNTLGGCAKPVD